MGEEERALHGEDMTAEELREALRERDLPVTGNKSALLERLQEAIDAEEQDGLVPVIRFDALADGQLWSHGRRSFGPGHEEAADPDALADWQEDALEAGVAHIIRIPQEG